MSSRKNRSPEEQARRAKIRELLQASNISSMEDIQDLFKETIAEFIGSAARKPTAISPLKGRCDDRASPPLQL